MLSEADALSGVKEDVAGGLSALIRVENLRDPKPTHRLLKAVYTETDVNVLLSRHVKTFRLYQSRIATQ